MGKKMTITELKQYVASKARKLMNESFESEEFIPNGTYTVSNNGGYEIMISNDGEMAKVRDAFGSDNPKTSDWLPIEYVSTPYYDEESGDEFEPIIDPKGYNIPLNQVMRKQSSENSGNYKPGEAFPAHNGLAEGKKNVRKITTKELEKYVLSEANKLMQAELLKESILKEVSININGKIVKTYTQNGDKSYNVTYDDGTKDKIMVSNDSWDKINILHKNATNSINEDTNSLRATLHTLVGNEMKLGKRADMYGGVGHHVEEHKKAEKELEMFLLKNPSMLEFVEEVEAYFMNRLRENAKVRKV